MNEYLEDNLILGDWLENFFGWITLPQGTEGHDVLDRHQLNPDIKI